MKRRITLKSLSKYSIDVQEGYLNRYYQNIDGWQTYLFTENMKSLIPLMYSLAVSSFMFDIMKRAVNKDKRT